MNPRKWNPSGWGEYLGVGRKGSNGAVGAPVADGHVGGEEAVAVAGKSENGTKTGENGSVAPDPPNDIATRTPPVEARSAEEPVNDADSQLALSATPPSPSPPEISPPEPEPELEPEMPSIQVDREALAEAIQSPSSQSSSARFEYFPPLPGSPAPPPELVELRMKVPADVDDEEEAYRTEWRKVLYIQVCSRFENDGLLIADHHLPFFPLA